MESFVDNASQRPGDLLAAERERQGLSCNDVAQRLHMSVSQVEALESGDYGRLPRGPFLRGFFRNYARLLNLPPDSVLSLLAEAAPRDPAPKIVVPSQNIRFDPLGERLGNPYVKAASLAAVVIAVGFAAMYWWLFVRATPANVAARKPVAAEAVSSNLAKPAAPPPASSAMPGESANPQPAPPVAGSRTAAEPPPAPLVAALEPARAESPKAEPAKAEPAKAETVPVAPREGSLLRFRFGGESWVEVRDVRGRVLMSGLNAPGSVAEVNGKPPLRVTVGNAAAVELQRDGRSFDLAPHTRESVARFSIE